MCATFQQTVTYCIPHAGTRITFALCHMPNAGIADDTCKHRNNMTMHEKYFECHVQTIFT